MSMAVWAGEGMDARELKNETSRALTGPSRPCLRPALLTSMHGKPAATSSVSCTGGQHSSSQQCMLSLSTQHTRVNPVGFTVSRSAGQPWQQWPRADCAEPIAGATHQRT